MKRREDWPYSVQSAVVAMADLLWPVFCMETTQRNEHYIMPTRNRGCIHSLHVSQASKACLVSTISLGPLIAWVLLAFKGEARRWNVQKVVESVVKSLENGRFALFLLGLGPTSYIYVDRRLVRDNIIFYTHPQV